MLLAASAGNVEVAKELIGAGANVTASNDKEQTALHYAARLAAYASLAGNRLILPHSKGGLEIARLLIERGADINARDKANQLPLYASAKRITTASSRILVIGTAPLRQVPHR